MNDPEWDPNTPQTPLSSELTDEAQTDWKRGAVCVTGHNKRENYMKREDSVI